jgi:hypothetical protein
VNPVVRADRPFSVSFTITADDVVAFLRLAQRRLNTVVATMGVILVALGLALSIQSGEATAGLLEIVVGLTVFGLTATEFLDRWRVGRVARSIVGTTNSFTFDSNGITAQTATGSGRIPWDAVTQTVENERMLLIKRDRLTVVWIPKRAFASPDDVALLRSLILSHARQGA